MLKIRDCHYPGADCQVGLAPSYLTVVQSHAEVVNYVLYYAKKHMKSIQKLRRRKEGTKTGGVVTTPCSEEFSVSIYQS